MCGKLMLWLAATVLLAAATQPDSAAPSSNDHRTAPGLQDLVETFFLSDDAGERDALIRRIETAAGGSIEAVIRAVENASLWPPIAGRGGTFQVESTEGSVEVSYRLAAHYDPARAYPLIVWLPEPDSPIGTRSLYHFLFNTADDRFVAIHPTRPINWSFHRNGSADIDLPTLLRHVKPRIHIDSDRVFLMGVRAGGDAAWMGAIMHPDLFAGAYYMLGYPPVPYAEQVYPFLLENIRYLPVKSVWPGASCSAQSLRSQAVDFHNRSIAAIAQRNRLPLLVSVDLCEDRSDPGVPSTPPLLSFLEKRRPRPPREVSHWFRYPNQGQAGWLRQTRFKDEMWTAEQLSILPAATTDRDAYITEIVKSKLAYLGGRIEGQTIIIETQRCARIDILLTEDLVDLSRPVTVRCNGRQRHRGPLRRSIRTLLTRAYETWDFQRLIVASLSLDIQADGTPP